MEAVEVDSSKDAELVLDKEDGKTEDVGHEDASSLKEETISSPVAPVIPPPPSKKEDKLEESGDGTNIFVNFLPPEYDDTALGKLFQPFGKIISAKVMVDLSTGQSRCFGFVKFLNHGDGVIAIQRMNGEMVGGKKLAVKMAESIGSAPTPSGTPSNNLYIKGLPLTMTEDQLYALFQPYGTVEQWKVLKDKSTGLSKGQGFVRFEKPTSAEYAISALHGYVFPGTVKGVIVRYADTDQEKAVRKQKHQRRMQLNQRYNPYPYPAPNMPMMGHHMAAPYYPPAAMPMTAAPMTAVPTAAAATDSTLFVYHLPQSADDALLYRLFGPYGPIMSVKVVRDPTSQACKGYGFVTMGNWMSAANAIQGLNGYKVENKHLQVSWKKSN